MTRSAFERLPVSPETEAAYERGELAQLRAMLERARGESGLTVKRLEKMVLAARAAPQGQLDGPRDPGISFEQTGIDYLRHVTRRTTTRTCRPSRNIRDAAIDGSKRASDLHMKIEYLRSRHGAAGRDDGDRDPDREQHHRGARDEPLPAARPARARPASRTSTRGRRRSGRPSPRSRWPRPAAGTIACTPASPASRTSPRCCEIWHVFADVKTAEDLELPVPELAHARRRAARRRDAR